jgi:hypothetical protein
MLLVVIVSVLRNVILPFFLIVVFPFMLTIVQLLFQQNALVY